MIWANTYYLSVWVSFDLFMTGEHLIKKTTVSKNSFYTVAFHLLEGILGRNKSLKGLQQIPEKGFTNT
jgi:hypothetical protein